MKVKLSDRMISVIVLSIFIGVITIPIILIEYSGQYYTDSGGSTATNGIIFKSTINLDVYSVIGEGSNLMCLGKGHIKYTRSINHEVIKVCK